MEPMQQFDKSQRSVFVGNIPYEVTEEKLKEIFSAVGPVLSFKLVYDRENGKPKGYGFAEFADPETASSAMRNLNGYEIGGRTLRVDSASTSGSNQQQQQQQQQTMDGQQQMMQQQLQQQIQAQMEPKPYGDPVDPKDAPEAISKTVASLPPEEMFKLMDQMKQCIQNNPQEARDMLLRNPQLSYALLQAQVVMKIVDPDLAVTMLHKNPSEPPNFAHQPRPAFHPPQQQQQQQQPHHHQPFGAHAAAGGGGGYRHEADRRDPRGGMNHRDPRAGTSQQQQQPMIPPQLAGTDPEKAKLIMQVMSLTDDQISMLPREQRDSILQLKRQMNSIPPQ